MVIKHCFCYWVCNYTTIPLKNDFDIDKLVGWIVVRVVVVLVDGVDLVQKKFNFAKVIAFVVVALDGFAIVYLLLFFSLLVFV